MVGVKELYLCQSLEELQEQAGTGDMSLIPAKRLCESSQKVFKTAQLEQDLDGTRCAVSLFTGAYGQTKNKMDGVNRAIPAW